MPTDVYGAAFPRLTPAVRVLLWINFGVFLLHFLWFMAATGTLSHVLGVSPGRLAANPFLGVFTLVTYQFLHAVLSPWHLLINMLLLYFFGTLVEGSIGTRPFVWLYLLSGVAGGVLWLLFCLVSGMDVPTVGASGAIYGILVYAACMYPRMDVFLLIFRIQLWIVAAVLVGVGFYVTIISLRVGPGGVAHAAHLGGAAFGFAAWHLRRLGMGYRIAASLERMDRRAREARTARLDAILDKINREGMSSLNWFERRFLARQSRDRRSGRGR